ncbi:hypothetical protein [Sneathiella sp. HT1-7]|nr:hypothetical protein [Sneathiella sp. HT1-7]MCC3306740.1 hypothetical protein [Sneathiella sp. HT1-7]
MTGLIHIIHNPEDTRLPDLAREALGLLVEQLITGRTQVKASEASLLT